MPAAIVGTDIVKDAVRVACRAPSLHNIQPWQWVFDGDGQLQLFLEQSRVLPSYRSDRQALIGCGAAFDHLRVAMAAAGWRGHVDRFPNPDQSNHPASTHFTPMNCVTEEHRRRGRAIWKRRSNRLPFAAPTDWDDLDPLLHNTIDRDAVHLDVLDDDERPRSAQATKIAESLRPYDPSYHAELRRWTGPFKFPEDISCGSLAAAAEGEHVDVERAFRVANRAERRAWIPKDDATILVLSTDTDDRAGTAGHPEMVATIVGSDAMPQILVRVGLILAQDHIGPPAPRRQLEEVCE